MKGNAHKKKFKVAVPFLVNSYMFKINRKNDWSIIDYLFIKELFNNDLTLDELSNIANLNKQIVLQIVLPMHDIGWIVIKSENNLFSFSLSETGRKTYINSRATHELPSIITTYDSVREICLDNLGNYYNFFKKDVLLHPYIRYQEIKNQYNSEIVELPILNDVYPDYEKIGVVAKTPNEEIDNISDIHSYKFQEKKFLIIDMMVTGKVKSILINDKLKDILEPNLIAEIENLNPKHNEKKLQDIQNNYYREPVSAFTLATTKDDVEFIFGGRNTETKFIDLIKKSKDYLIIHSTFIGNWCIKKDNEGYTEPFCQIKEALKRNTLVYILWGKSNHEEDVDSVEEDIMVQKLLHQFNEDCLNEGIENLVNYNNFMRTNSHAKFIVTNTMNQGPCVMLGSCNFLYSKFDRFEASIAIYNHNFTQKFLEIVANIVSGDSSYNTSAREEIRNLITYPQEETKDLREKEKLTVSLVLKNQHYRYVDMAKEQATKRIIVTSDLINSIAKRSIYDALKHSTVKKTLIYSNRSSHINYDEIKDKIIELENLEYPIRLRTSQNKNHSKVLAWDNNNILVTSLNWLSSNAFHGNDDYHEMGIHVQGWDVAKEIFVEFQTKN